MKKEKILDSKTSTLLSYLEGINDLEFAINNNCDNKKRIPIIIKNMMKTNSKLEKIYGRKFDHFLSSSSDDFIYYPSDDFNSLNEKGNIILISHELSRTGAPVVLADTAKILMKNGYFVIVVTPVDGPLKDEILDNGIPVIVSNEMKEIFYKKMKKEDFKKKLTLDTLVNSFDITLMCTATLYNFVSRYINTDRKIIWWIHEGHVSYNILGNRLPKKISSNISVFGGGQYVCDQLKLFGFDYGQTVLNYGVVDTTDKKKILYNRKGKSVKFLLAGSVCERKGQLILFEAIDKLSYKYLKKSEFIFIGKPYSDDIASQNIYTKMLKMKDRYPNVTIKSEISREELYDIYNEIDVLVVPSTDDPMPVVATENFMMGNICICSSNTGTSHYIIDCENSFVFETNNSDELCEKIIKIIDNMNNLSNMTKKSREIYDKYFNMNIFEEKILKLIEEKMR